MRVNFFNLTTTSRANNIRNKKKKKNRKYTNIISITNIYRIPVSFKQLS